MPSPVQIEWKRLPGHPQLKGRAGHSATLVGRRIFVLGGRHGNECFNDFWVFDTDLEIWQQLQSAPFCPRAYHTATLVAENQLWVIGGNDLKNNCGDVHVLNTTTLKWTVPTTKGSIANKPRGAHAAILHPVINKGILVFGGYGGVIGTWLSDLSILHTDTLEWEELTPNGKAPGGTGYHTLTALGTQVVLFGGKGANGIIAADILSIYDAVENKWTTRKSRGITPLARASHKATLVGSNQIVIHGGRNGAKRLSDTCVLQAQLCRTSASYRWHVVGPCKHSRSKSVGERLAEASILERPQGPEGRAAHSLLSRDRELYIFGGYGGNGKYFSDIYVMRGLPELPASGDKRRKSPAMVSKFQRLLEGYEADEQEVEAGGWRSAKQRRTLQVNPGNESAEQGELPLELTHLETDHALSGEVRVESYHGREDCVALAASRRIEDRLNASLEANHHVQRGEPAYLPSISEAQETENRNLRRDVQAQDRQIVSLESELAKMRSTISQRIRDFETEIESLHEKLRAGEKQSQALENENLRMKETVQHHVKEIQNQEVQLAETITKLRTSEERAATMQKSLEEVTKTNLIMINERDEHKLNVQRLEMELHKGAQNHEQTCIAHEKEKAFLLNEREDAFELNSGRYQQDVAERRGTADRLLTELGTFKESARSLQDTLDLLAKQLERESSKVDVLHMETEELKKLNAALSGECLQLSTAKNTAETAAEVLRAELQAAQALNHQKECEIAKLKDTLLKSKEHIDSLHASKKKDDESIQALQTSNEQLRNLAQEVEDFERGHGRSVQTILEKLRCARQFCTG